MCVLSITVPIRKKSGNLSYAHRNCIKMDLALNNLQRLICHKTQTSNQQQIYISTLLLLLGEWFSLSTFEQIYLNQGIWILNCFLNILFAQSIFGLVLGHTNHCRLLNAKSILYIYIRYIISKLILLVTFSNGHWLFFFKRFNGFTYFSLMIIMILFTINHLSAHSLMFSSIAIHH